MIINYKAFILLLFGCFLISNCNRQKPVASAGIQSLPLNQVPLKNLSAFHSSGSNWQIAGGVSSDYQTEHSMDIQDGTGTAVNIPVNGENENLFTKLEHGDIELQVEFMVPKGSNSGIYFQGRYEVQIFDSWGIEDPQFSDAGGIYERWDESKSEGQEGYDGHAPLVNAGKAPGLWQEYHILFRAPRFDVNGNKIRNARFDWVELNGKRIHEDVEVSGPGRGAAFEDETAKAPLMLQGDHGPVAFRNIRYKTFDHADSLSLGEMKFVVYDYDGAHVPGFDTLEVFQEGITSHIETPEISSESDNFAIRFRGDVEVPIAGNYLLQSHGEVYINGNPVIKKEEENNTTLGNIVHLTGGTHQLDILFLRVNSGSNISVLYEGPNMEKRRLGEEISESNYEPYSPMVVQPDAAPELIGSFVNYHGEKRTHVLSVGHPEKIHYSYDLNRASLLNKWKGPFADVSDMWRGRGFSQLLVPLNAVTENKAGIPIARLGSDDTFSNHVISDELTGKGYLINNHGRPVFNFDYDGISFQDEIFPSDNAGGLVRKLRFESDRLYDDMVSRVAQGRSIELLSDGLYRVNGEYYVQLDETSGQEAIMQEHEGIIALFIPILSDVNESEVQYQIIW